MINQERTSNAPLADVLAAMSALSLAGRANLAFADVLGKFLVELYSVFLPLRTGGFGGAAQPVARAFPLKGTFFFASRWL